MSSPNPSDKEEYAFWCREKAAADTMLCPNLSTCGYVGYCYHRSPHEDSKECKIGCPDMDMSGCIRSRHRAKEAH